jgi:uncharacterized protein (DUF2164 family)|tara:strand:+ start:2490 stop:3818 length:1329 start_codon:yes stop_codon:yes gene_type:complete
MNGIYCESKQTDAMKIYSALRTKHNNNSERPFAIAKELRRCFPTMKLSTIEGLVLATQNKTFVRKSKVTEKTQTKFRKAGDFSGFYYSLTAKQKAAVRKVAKDTTYIEEAKMRMTRFWQQKKVRMEAKRKKQKDLVDGRVIKALDAFAVGRLTAKQLKKGLKKCRKLDKKGKQMKDEDEKIIYYVGKRKDLLEGQIRFRKVGCSFTYDDVEISLLSNVENRMEKMEAMLYTMMAAECTTQGKIRYKTPTVDGNEQAVVKGVYRFVTPTLGRTTDIRGKLDEYFEKKSNSLIDLIDDVELLQFEAEFKGKVFFDDGVNDGADANDREETRVIVAIEYSQVTKQWQARSHIVNRNGTAKEHGASKKEQWYIIGDYLRQTIQMHQDNLVNDEINRLARIERKKQIAIEKEKKAKRAAEKKRKQQNQAVKKGKKHKKRKKSARRSD